MKSLSNTNALNITDQLLMCTMKAKINYFCYSKGEGHYVALDDQTATTAVRMNRTTASTHVIILLHCR
jgi:hypothetical protein